MRLRILFPLFFLLLLMQTPCVQAAVYTNIVMDCSQEAALIMNDADSYTIYFNGTFILEQSPNENSTTIVRGVGNDEAATWNYTVYPDNITYPLGTTGGETPFAFQVNLPPMPNGTYYFFIEFYTASTIPRGVITDYYLWVDLSLEVSTTDPEPPNGINGDGNPPNGNNTDDASPFPIPLSMAFVIVLIIVVIVAAIALKRKLG